MNARVVSRRDKQTIDDPSNGYEAVASAFMERREQRNVGLVTTRRWARSLPRGAVVLDHLPERDAVLRRLVEALTPMALQAEVLTPADFDWLLAMMTSDDFHGLSNSLFAARGRKVAASPTAARAAHEVAPMNDVPSSNIPPARLWVAPRHRRCRYRGLGDCSETPGRGSAGYVPQGRWCRVPRAAANRTVRSDLRRRVSRKVHASGQGACTAGIRRSVRR